HSSACQGEQRPSGEVADEEAHGADHNARKKPERCYHQPRTIPRYHYDALSSGLREKTRIFAQMDTENQAIARPKPATRIRHWIRSTCAPRFHPSCSMCPRNPVAASSLPTANYRDRRAQRRAVPFHGQRSQVALIDHRRQEVARLQERCPSPCLPPSPGPPGRYDEPSQNESAGNTGGAPSCLAKGRSCSPLRASFLTLLLSQSRSRQQKRRDQGGGVGVKPVQDDAAVILDGGSPSARFRASATSGAGCAPSLRATTVRRHTAVPFILVASGSQGLWQGSAERRGAPRRTPVGRSTTGSEELRGAGSAAG